MWRIYKCICYVQPAFGGVIRSPVAKGEPLALLQLSRGSLTSNETLVTDKSQSADIDISTRGELSQLCFVNCWEF